MSGRTGGRTTAVLVACAFVLAAVVVGEAWYLWGVPAPSASAARPVVMGDIEARSVAETAAQDAAAIFTTSWQDYDEHLDRATGLMTDAFGTAYRSTAAPVRARVVSSRTRTSTRVASSGVVRATPDQVQVLLFLDQRVVAGTGPPSYNARRVLVTMERTDRGWLVGNVQTG
jgi:Mce-associated membrane protein